MVENEHKRLGSIWIKCSPPVIVIGLTQILEEEARVYAGSEMPSGEVPDFVVLCKVSAAPEDIPESIEHLRGLLPETPVLVFGIELDLSLAQTALKAGAMGFIHAGMEPSQIVRALLVASKGEVAAPRQMLEYMLAGGDRDKLAALSFRQQEIFGTRNQRSQQRPDSTAPIPFRVHHKTTSTCRLQAARRKKPYRGREALPGGLDRPS